MAKTLVDSLASEELALHIFISVMVLIRDFYAAFSKTYDEPAVEETYLCIELIWGFEYFVEQLAERKHGGEFANQLAAAIEPMLRSKIKSDLFPSVIKPSLDEDLQTTRSKIYSLLQNKTSKDGKLPFDKLAARISLAVKDKSPAFIKYSLEQIKLMFTQSVNFEDLINNAATGNK